MTRPLRITYPGAIYHVINRGCRKDNIFRRLCDREEFLSRLVFSSQKYGIIIHGYCLMDNHFHLLIETPNEKISEFMQLLQSGYANWFKVRYKMVGPLFQSRFKSVLVEDESYLVTLSAYIHLNPVRAKMVYNPSDFEWSTCGLYLKNERSELVDPSMVLEYAGGVENYKFIMSEMIDNPPLKEAIYGKFSILGTAAFKEKVARQIDDSEINIQNQPEIKKIKSVDTRIIQNAVMDEMKVDREALIEKINNNISRKLYLYFLKKYTTLQVSEIAKIAYMKQHSAGQFIRKFEKDLNDKEIYRVLIEKIERRLFD